MLYPVPGKLEEIRKAAKLSAYRLSLIAGLPENAIWRIEEGKVTRVQTLRAKEIARALGCEVAEIFSAEMPDELKKCG